MKINKRPLVFIICIYCIISLLFCEHAFCLSPKISINNIRPLFNPSNHLLSKSNNTYSNVKKITTPEKIPYPDYALTYLPGHFNVKINYKTPEGLTGIHNFSFSNTNLYKTPSQNSIIAVSVADATFPFYCVIKLNIKTGKIYDLKLFRVLPQELLQTPHYTEQIISKISKKSITDIIAYDNHSIKFGMQSFMSGHYFYTKHDENSWVYYENNKYYVHFYDKSRNIYLYFVLSPLKKPKYTFDKEFDFKFIKGYMSMNPLDESLLNKLKLIPKRYNLPFKIPIIKKILDPVNLQSDEGLITPINSAI